MPPPFSFSFFALELAKPRPAFAYAFALLLARLVVVRKVAFAPYRLAADRVGEGRETTRRNNDVKQRGRQRGRRGIRVRVTVRVTFRGFKGNLFP